MTTKRNVLNLLNDLYCVCVCCCAEQCDPQCPWCNGKRHSCLCMYCPAEPCDPDCLHLNCNPGEAETTRQEIARRFRELWREGVVFERALSWMTDRTEPDRAYILVDRKGDRREVNGRELQEIRGRP